MFSSKIFIWLLILCTGLYLQYVASSSEEKVLNSSQELKYILNLLGQDKGEFPHKMDNCERVMKFISGLLKKYGSEELEEKFNVAHLAFDFCKSGLVEDPDLKYNVVSIKAKEN